MGKFKIGARVVDSDGDTGTIIGKRKGERQVRYDNPAYRQDGWFSKDWFSVLGVDVEEAPGESGEVAPAAFKVGDRVKNNSAPERGYGTVVRITDTGMHVRYDNFESGHDADTGDGSTDHWWDIFACFEPIQPTLRKGDRAISRNGDCVTVESDVDSADHVWVSHGTTKWLTPVSWLTKWEPKVGEKVRGSINPLDYTVTAVNSDGTLDVTRGNNLDYPAVRIGLFEPLPAAPQKPWTLADALDGQTVRCDEWAGEYFTPGKTYKIEGTNIRTNHGDVYTIANISTCGGKFSLVDPIPESKFKVGDRVRCVNKDDPSYNQVGTVVRKNLLVSYEGWTGGHAGCDDKGEYDKSHWFQVAEDLEPYTPQPYTIGDRVTLNAPARITGLNGKAANLVLSTGGTYSLPLAALTPTN